MENPFLYGFPILFREPVWVPLITDPETLVLIKPLPYSTIQSLQSNAYLTSKDDSYVTQRTTQEFLELAIIDTRDAIGFPTIASLIKQLPKEDATYLSNKLFEISTVNAEQSERLSQMLDIQFNDAFQDDSWNCTICQEKKLDYARGCGYLPEDKRDRAPSLPKVDGKRLTVCPISALDGYVLNQAGSAHQMLDKGILPEEGGMGNQTDFFVKATTLYKRKISEAERNAMEESKSKRK